MTAARSQRVDVSVTFYDHCISRSVRHVALRRVFVFSPSWTTVCASWCGWIRARRWARRISGVVASGGWIRRIPGPGRGWTKFRDMRRPAKQSFSDWFKERNET